MEISVDRVNEVLIAKIEGRIDGANAREFEEALNGAIAEDDGKVLLDFAALSYISSAGLRVILLIARLLQKRNAAFALCSLSDPIREVFEISGFDKIISIHDTQVEAVEKIGQ